MIARAPQLFHQAMTGQFALGAFNASNLELAQAVIRAAEETNAPVIVQTSEGAISYAGLPTMSAMLRTLAEQARVPVIIHLDHGKSFELAQQCIEAGYTSVMIDISKADFAENIATTKQVVAYAHARDVWVEAELGAILGQEGMQSGMKTTPEDYFTNPAQAAEFVAATGVDALAVSVGTIHGAFSGQEYVRFELLEEIQKAVPQTPLVLHGASGISDVHISQAIAKHVCKINVDTELRQAFEQAIKGYLGQPHQKVDPRDMLGAGRDAVQAVVAQKISLFGGSGKAG